MVSHTLITQLLLELFAGKGKKKVIFISYHIGIFCCFRGVRCCHHKLVRVPLPSLFLSWINGNRRLRVCDHDGEECEILILPSSSPSAFPHSHTRAVSHASATSFNRMGRARPAASGEICLFWGHYAMTLCSLCGSHTVPPIENGEKRKMDITPYGFTCVCSCAHGASPSLLSPPSSFPREYSK